MPWKPSCSEQNELFAWRKIDSSIAYCIKYSRSLSHHKNTTMQYELRFLVSPSSIRLRGMLAIMFTVNDLFAYKTMVNFPLDFSALLVKPWRSKIWRRSEAMLKKSRGIDILSKLYMKNFHGYTTVTTKAIEQHNSHKYFIILI